VTGELGPKKGHRLRLTTDIVAATLIATGAVFAGISFSQHQHYEHALSVQAARKADVDRAALLEAQRLLADGRAERGRPQTGGSATGRSATGRSASGRAQFERSPQAHQAGVSAKVRSGSHAEAQQSQAATSVPVANRQVAARPPAANPQVAPGQARRPLSTAQPVASRVTQPGAVSEIQGAGARLIIPALQVQAPVVATGAVDGSMTIPADIHTVGWYDGTDISGRTTTSAPTPWPGQSGVSLLAGHVDWSGKGPGALYYIGQLVVGDPVEVIGSDGVATYWKVSEPPITTPKADLPADLFLNTGPPRLALVTCGGSFDPATRHYLDNVIVWATLSVR
jgi:Sortase domain